MRRERERQAKARTMRLIYSTIIIVCAVILVGAVAKLTKRVEPSSQPKQTTAAKNSESFQLIAMGDMLAHDSIVQQAKKASSYDFTPYFKDIKHHYTSDDVVFCNPETPVAGEQIGVSGYPTFNAPNEFARDLAKSGCNTINLATNHIFDKGQPGINESRTVWQQQSLLAMNGANNNATEQSKVNYFEKNGVKCAFVAFADFSNAAVPDAWSVNFYHDKALVERLVGEARQKADVVIVSAHWGTEDSTVVNDDQRAAAQLFADTGADVVIGTGPHVLQSVESLSSKSGRKTLVWYSIGNMLSSQLAVNELTGIIASMKITKKDGKVTINSVEATPTFMSYDWPEADKAAGTLQTRTNLTLRTLKDAKDAVPIMFKDESYDTRRQFVAATLGSLVTVSD